MCSDNSIKGNDTANNTSTMAVLQETHGLFNEDTSTGPLDDNLPVPAIPPPPPQAAPAVAGATMFHMFTALPVEVQCMIWAETWNPRTVSIRRDIVRDSLRSKSRPPPAHDRKVMRKQAKVESRRRHRDRVLHSNAVMSINWDGVPAYWNGLVPSRSSRYPPGMVGLKYTSPTGNNLNVHANNENVSPPTLAAPLSRQPTLDDFEAQRAAWRALSYNQRKLLNREGRHLLETDLTRVQTITKYAGENQNPVSLRVSRGSREYTESRYRLAFDIAGGETQVYFCFEWDTLFVPRHVQLWRAFSKLDLGQLRYLRMPAVLEDQSGDYNTVGKVTDVLFATAEDGTRLVYKDPTGIHWVQGTGPEQSKGARLASMGFDPAEQTEYIFSEPRSFLEVMMPNLKVLYLCNGQDCKRSSSEAGHVKCSSARCGHRWPGGSYTVDQYDPGADDDKWGPARAVSGGAPDHLTVPFLGRYPSSTGLNQRVFDRRTGQLADVIQWKTFVVREGCEVVMMAVDHRQPSLPSLGEWSGLRIYPWSRHVTQVSAVAYNLKWFLELCDDGKRICNIMDYVL